MPYIEEICVTGKIEEHIKYYSWYIHPPGTKREKGTAPSEERIKKANQRQAEKKLRRLLNNNFKDGDLLIRLDFFKDKDKVQTSADMQKCMANFIKRLRRRTPNIRYVFVKEIGKRGARHAHMVLSQIPLSLISECWDHGGIHADPLYSGGQYGRIAAYFIKYAGKTEETEGKLIGKRWYGSRNLDKPIVKKRIVMSGSFRKEPPQKDGWALDKESVTRGVTSAGYEYMSYSYIRLTPEEPKEIPEEQNIYERLKSYVRRRFSVDKFISFFNRKKSEKH